MSRHVRGRTSATRLLRFHVSHPAADPAALLDDPACQQLLNQPARKGCGVAAEADSVSERRLGDLLDVRAACEQLDDGIELTGMHDDLVWCGRTTPVVQSVSEVCGRCARGGGVSSCREFYRCPERPFERR